MKSRSKELLDRSISSMAAAIEIYNKPGFQYRMESFCILSINAWELLVKAKWLADHKNDVRSLYLKEQRDLKKGAKSRKKYIKKTRSGNPYTQGIVYLSQKLVEGKKLDTTVCDNIGMLLELRDNATHFYNSSTEFRRAVFEIGAACVKNFSTVVREWFSRGLSEFELYLMPLTFIDLPSRIEGVLVTLEEKNFISFVNSVDSKERDPSSPYSVTVNVDIRFTKSSARSAFVARLTTAEDATEIRLTEEQIIEKYPWDYDELTDKCQARYSDFKMNKPYHKLRRTFENDSRYCLVRHLDPRNSKSGSKRFFNPNILQEFDKHYMKIP